MNISFGFGFGFGFGFCGLLAAVLITMSIQSYRTGTMLPLWIPLALGAVLMVLLGIASASSGER